MVVKKLVSTASIPLALALAVGCGGTDVAAFEGYGSGQPGSDDVAGGEILFERIDRYLPDIDQAPITYTTFHAYGFDSAAWQTVDDDAAFPAPGECTELLSGENWPTQVFPSDAQWKDWGESFTLTRGGDGAQWDIQKVVADDGDPMTEDFLLDNRPNYNRHHPFLYGGPTWAADAVDAWIEDTEYTVSLKNDGGEEMTFFTPPFHVEPLDIGHTTENIVVPASGDWDITWEPVPQAEGASHTKQHHFAFLAFGRIDIPPGAPIALYVCPAAEDGTITITRDVIDSLPDQGIIQSGRLTHYMDVKDGRRFDLVAIDCTIGWYQKEGTSTEQ